VAISAKIYPLLGRPTAEQIATFSVGGLAMAFISHTALAETWIRRTRRNIHPGTVLPSGPARRPGPMREGDASAR
jgi:hypothetical protein